MKRLELRAWWPDLLQQKDSCSLRELGERFGVSPGAINAALKRNGIQRCPARPGPRSGTGGVSAGSKGRPTRKVSEARLAPYEAHLGVLSDAQLAKQSGLSVATVARIRRDRQIDSAPNVGGRERGGSRIEPYQELLGALPDEDIAVLAGVTRTAVRNFRTRRSIPSMSERKRSAGAKQRAPSTQNADNQLAYEIDCLDGRRGVILGQDVVEVARRARENGLKVRGIRLVGPVFLKG